MLPWDDQDVQCDTPQGRHVAGGMARAQVATVLLEDFTQHPVAEHGVFSDHSHSTAPTRTVGRWPAPTISRPST